MKTDKSINKPLLFHSSGGLTSSEKIREVLNLDIQPNNNILTVSDLKKRYGIGNDAAYALVRREDFPSFRYFNKFLIREDLLLKWEEEEIEKSHGGVKSKHK